MAAHDHRFFTRLYGVIADLGEHSELGAARTEVLAGAHGRLLIVGLGPGHDLDHLPGRGDLRRGHRAQRLDAGGLDAEGWRPRGLGGLEVELIDAVGEALPLPDDSVDCVLFAYVLCSVDSVEDVLAEARRVLHPDGTVCVLEHVRAEPGTWTERMQRAVSVGGLWPAAGRWVPVHPGHAGGAGRGRVPRGGPERADAGERPGGQLDADGIQPAVGCGRGRRSAAQVVTGTANQQRVLDAGRAWYARQNVRRGWLTGSPYVTDPGPVPPEGRHPVISGPFSYFRKPTSTRPDAGVISLRVDVHLVGARGQVDRAYSA